MIANDIRATLQAIEKCEVSSLLSGGQACVLYGAAEFTRDVDFMVLAESSNFERLKEVATRLDAETIAVPPFEKRFLDEGLAIHLRCGREDCKGLRLDFMSRMRGVDPFVEVWERRKVVEIDELRVSLMGIADLVQSKKTQRDKDWPMIRRLVEADYYQAQECPEESDILFWARESRTPAMLIDLAHRFPLCIEQVARARPLLNHAIGGDAKRLDEALVNEMQHERELDRQYWRPLRERLAELRREHRRQ